MIQLCHENTQEKCRKDKDMIRKGQKKKSVFVSLLALCFALSACQPTPEEEIITQKNTLSVLPEVASTADAEDAGEQTDTMGEKLSLPERYCYEAEDASGRVHLSVDAEVIAPQTASMPVARITPRSFTTEDAQALYATLMSDALSIAPNGPLYKDYWQPPLEELLTQKNSGKRDMKYATEAELDEAIAQVVKKMDAEPDAPVSAPPDFSFTQYDRSEEMTLWGVRDGLYLSTLELSNSTEAGDMGTGSQGAYMRNVWDNTTFSSVRNSYTSEEIWAAQASGISFTPPSMPQTEARDLAQALMERAGLAEYTLTGDRLIPLYASLDDRDAEYKSVYEFMYTRSVQGVAETFTNTAVALGTDDLIVMRPWYYERIRIFVDDGGIYALLWDSPSTVEILYEDVALLPFEQIQAIFETQFMRRYGVYDETGTGGRYEIHTIKLGLARICEKDHTANALLVPVWDFFGTCTGEDGSVKGLDGYDSLLTINALDGSVIDRESGY